MRCTHCKQCNGIIKMTTTDPEEPFDDSKIKNTTKSSRELRLCSDCYNKGGF